MKGNAIEQDSSYYQYIQYIIVTMYDVVMDHMPIFINRLRNMRRVHADHISLSYMYIIRPLIQLL